MYNRRVPLVMEEKMVLVSEVSAGHYLSVRKISAAVLLSSLARSQWEAGLSLPPAFGSVFSLEVEIGPVASLIIYLRPPTQSYGRSPVLWR